MTEKEKEKWHCATGPERAHCSRLCLLHNLLLVDVVGPPSAEVCRTVANFPQVDDLRFINLGGVG